MTPHKGETLSGMHSDPISSTPAVPSLIKALRDSDEDKLRPGLAALVRMGESAVPELIQLLQHTDPWIRRYTAWVLGEIGSASTPAGPALIQALKDTASWVRSAAAWALGRIGPDAVPAIPDLIQLLGESLDSGVWEPGDLGLEAMISIPALNGELLGVALSPETSEDVASCASWALARIGEPTVPALLQALQAPDALTRIYAADALGRIGTSSAVTALIRRLDDTDSSVIRSAIVALGAIGPAAAAAIPTLIEMLRAANNWDGSPLPSALAKIGSNATVIDALLQALVHPDTLTPRPLAAALASIGEPAGPGLIGALQVSDRYVRDYTAWALGRIGPAAAPAVEALCQILQDRDENVQATVAWALGEIGPAAAAAIPHLRVAMTDVNERVQRGAIRALSGIGVPALPTLIEALENPSAEVRKAVGLALADIKAPAIPALIDAIQHRKEVAQRTAALALGRMGPTASPAAPSLINLLRSPDEEVCREAAQALAELAPASVPFLRNALRDSTDQNLRTKVAQVLFGIAPEALMNDLPAQVSKGIAQFPPAETAVIIEELRVFRQVGELCRTRESNSFQFPALAAELAIGEATLRRYMNTISRFFRNYFKRYEGLAVPDDDDALADPEVKLLDRGQGKKRTTICPLGWRAWEETCRYLDSTIPRRDA